MADALGNAILDLLWEPIDEDDAARIVRRLGRLRAILDAVPSGSDVCRLLSRLQPGGDLQPDFDYRLKTSTRNELRERLRGRCWTGHSKPTDVPRKPDKPDKPDEPPPPPPPSKPTPATPRRTWQHVVEYVFASKPRRRRKFKRWDLYAWFEAELTVSVNATDAELVTIKTRWQKGEYKPEVEIALADHLGFDVKVEKDKGSMKVQFKRDIGLAGGLIEFTPTLQLSLTEPIKAEVVVPKFAIRQTINGWDFKIDVEPKIVFAGRVNWARVVKDRVKDTVRDLVEELLDFFGKKIIGGTIRKILVGLVGLVVVKLVLDRDADPPPPTPGDVAGHDRALTLAGGSAAAKARLLREAASYRTNYSTALGDTLARLTESDWQTWINSYNSVTSRAFVGLLPEYWGDPCAGRRWEQWAPDAGREKLETVHLDGDDYEERFRSAEAALLFALAAFLTRRLSDYDLATARRTAHEQASVAGMAAAVTHVRGTVRRETYDFIDETGKLQRRSGNDAWDGMAEMARSAEPGRKERQRRLAGLVTDVLPPLRARHAMRWSSAPCTSSPHSVA